MRLPQATVHESEGHHQDDNLMEALRHTGMFCLINQCLRHSLSSDHYLMDLMALGYCGLVMVAKSQIIGLMTSRRHQA